ncbi:hypothetical protein AAG906_035937 [Vitis piasezkii]
MCGGDDHIAWKCPVSSEAYKGLYHYETIPPPTVTVLLPILTTTYDTRLVEYEARVERLEDDILAASVLAKFRMSDIERYSRIGCPNIHLRLYNTVMRTHMIDDAQLVTLFPILFLPLLVVGGQMWLGLVHVAFSVEEAIARGLWTDIAHSPDSNGKKSVGSSSRSGKVGTIRVFEKLKEVDLIVPLEPHPLPHPIPHHFRPST